jgi:exopolyphosphatase/guanosine-5'-triphosphate,3'-diphosphate pyrophosphatase
VRRAAIDIGTVTTRLLIADVADGLVTERLRRTVVTHLGENLRATGRLDASAIARVRNAVAGFSADIARLGAEYTVTVATSASRDAGNSADLSDSLAEVGVKPVVIPGATEARLSFVGATYERDARGILVADLGGGSTELVLGAAGGVAGDRRVEISTASSVDVGSRRVLDAFLASDPPTSDELDRASRWAAAEMRPFFQSLRERPRILLTLAGTGTTLSAVKQGLEPYDAAMVHGSVLTRGDVAGLREKLAAMPVTERRLVPGMDPERADVIVAGAVILEAILGLSGLDSTTISEHDILYGLVLEGEKIADPGYGTAP